MPASEVEVGEYGEFLRVGDEAVRISAIRSVRLVDSVLFVGCDAGPGLTPAFRVDFGSPAEARGGYGEILDILAEAS